MGDSKYLLLKSFGSNSLTFYGQGLFQRSQLYASLLSYKQNIPCKLSLPAFTFAKIYWLVLPETGG